MTTREKGFGLAGMFLSACISGIIGTVSVLAYAESHFKSKTEADLVDSHIVEQLNKIEKSVDKLHEKIDDLVFDRDED